MTGGGVLRTEAWASSSGSILFFFAFQFCVMVIYQMVHLTCYLLTFVVAVHFWAPTFKWGISIANVADFAKPPEKISYPQQVGMFRLPKSLSFRYQSHTSLLCIISICLYCCCGMQLLLALESFGHATVWL
jgi:hypothetical protein